MPLPAFPATLNCPKSILVVPVDHRHSATPERPRESRPGQLAGHWTMPIEFAPFTAAETELFREWWKTDLVFGGSWWRATWPSPRGSVELELKFRTAPSYTFIAGGMWSVSAEVEARFATAQV